MNGSRQESNREFVMSLERTLRILDKASQKEQRSQSQKMLPEFFAWVMNFSDLQSPRKKFLTLFERPSQRSKSLTYERRISPPAFSAPKLNLPQSSLHKILFSNECGGKLKHVFEFIERKFKLKDSRALKKMIQQILIDEGPHKNSNKAQHKIFYHLKTEDNVLARPKSQDNRGKPVKSTFFFVQPIFADFARKKEAKSVNCDESKLLFARFVLKIFKHFIKYSEKIYLSQTNKINYLKGVFTSQKSLNFKKFQSKMIFIILHLSAKFSLLLNSAKYKKLSKNMLEIFDFANRQISKYQLNQNLELNILLHNTKIVTLVKLGKYKKAYSSIVKAISFLNSHESDSDPFAERLQAQKRHNFFETLNGYSKLVGCFIKNESLKRESMATQMSLLREENKLHERMEGIHSKLKKQRVGEINKKGGKKKARKTNKKKKMVKYSKRKIKVKKNIRRQIPPGSIMNSKIHYSNPNFQLPQNFHKQIMQIPSLSPSRHNPSVHDHLVPRDIQPNHSSYRQGNQPSTEQGQFQEFQKVQMYSFDSRQKLNQSQSERENLETKRDFQCERENTYSQINISSVGNNNNQITNNVFNESVKVVNSNITSIKFISTVPTEERERTHHHSSNEQRTPANPHRQGKQMYSEGDYLYPTSQFNSLHSQNQRIAARNKNLSEVIKMNPKNLNLTFGQHRLLSSKASSLLDSLALSKQSRQFGNSLCAKPKSTLQNCKSSMESNTMTAENGISSEERERRNKSTRILPTVSSDGPSSREAEQKKVYSQSLSVLPSNPNLEQSNTQVQTQIQTDFSNEISSIECSFRNSKLSTIPEKRERHMSIVNPRKQQRLIPELKNPQSQYKNAIVPPLPKYLAHDENANLQTPIPESIHPQQTFSQDTPAPRFNNMKPQFLFGKHLNISKEIPKKLPIVSPDRAPKLSHFDTLQEIQPANLQESRFTFQKKHTANFGFSDNNSITNDNHDSEHVFSPNFIQPNLPKPAKVVSEQCNSIEQKKPVSSKRIYSKHIEHVESKTNRTDQANLQNKGNEEDSKTDVQINDQNGLYSRNSLFKNLMKEPKIKVSCVNEPNSLGFDIYQPAIKPSNEEGSTGISELNVHSIQCFHFKGKSRSPNSQNQKSLQSQHSDLFSNTELRSESGDDLGDSIEFQPKQKPTKNSLLYSDNSSSRVSIGQTPDEEKSKAKISKKKIAKYYRKNSDFSKSSFNTGKNKGRSGKNNKVRRKKKHKKRSKERRRKNTKTLNSKSTKDMITKLKRNIMNGWNPYDINYNNLSVSEYKNRKFKKSMMDLSNPDNKKYLVNSKSKPHFKAETPTGDSMKRHSLRESHLLGLSQNSFVSNTFSGLNSRKKICTNRSSITRLKKSLNTSQGDQPKSKSKISQPKNHTPRSTDTNKKPEKEPKLKKKKTVKMKKKQKHSVIIQSPFVRYNSKINFTMNSISKKRNFRSKTPKMKNSKKSILKRMKTGGTVKHKNKGKSKAKSMMKKQDLKFKFDENYDIKKKPNKFVKSFTQKERKNKIDQNVMANLSGPSTALRGAEIKEISSVKEKREQMFKNTLQLDFDAVKTEKQRESEKFIFTEQAHETKINNPFIRTKSESVPNSGVVEEMQNEPKKNKRPKKEKIQQNRHKNSLSLQKCSLSLQLNGFHKTENIQILAEYKEKKSKVRKRLVITRSNKEVMKQGPQLLTLIQEFQWFSPINWMILEEPLFMNSYHSIKQSFFRFFPSLTCGLDNSGAVHLGMKSNLLEIDLRPNDTWLIWVLGLEVGKIRLVFVRKTSIQDKILKETGENCSVTVRRRFINFVSDQGPKQHIQLVDTGKSRLKKDASPSFENKFSQNYFLNKDFESRPSQKGIEILKEEMIEGLEGVQYWKRYDCRIQNDKISDGSGSHRNAGIQIAQTPKVHEMKMGTPKEDAKDTQDSELEDQFIVDFTVSSTVFSHFFQNFEIEDQTQKSLDENRFLSRIFTWDPNVIDCYQDLKTKKVFSKKDFESKLKRYKTQFDNQRRGSRVNDLHKSTVVTRSRTEPLDSLKLPFERKNTDGARNKNRESFEDVSAKLRKKDSDFDHFLLTKGFHHIGLKALIEWVARVLKKFKDSSEEQNFTPKFKIATADLKQKLNETTLVVRGSDSVYLCSEESATNLKMNAEFVQIQKLISGEIFKKSGYWHEFIMNLVLKRTHSIIPNKPRSFDLPQLKKGFNEFIYLYDRTIKACNLDKWHEKVRQKKKSVFQKVERLNLGDTSINHYLESLPQVSFMLGLSGMQCTLESNDYNPSMMKGNYAPGHRTMYDSDTEDESITFTIRELIIEFSKTGSATSTGTVPQSASGGDAYKKSEKKNRYKIFVVSIPDFESMNKSDKLILLVDLENFNIGNCKQHCFSKRNIKNILDNLNFEKFGVNFAQHEKDNLKISSQAVIDHTKPRAKAITVESSRHVVWRNSQIQQKSETSIVKLQTPMSKHSEPETKVGSGVSIAKHMALMNTPEPDPNTGQFVYGTKLTMNSGMSPPFNNEGPVNPSFFSSRKIPKLDWRTSIMRTNKTDTMPCQCSKSIDDENFYKLLRANINNNTFSSLLYILVKSNILLFKLDSTLFS